MSWKRPKLPVLTLRCIFGATGQMAVGFVTGAAVGSAIPIVGQAGCGAIGAAGGLMSGLAASCVWK